MSERVRMGMESKEHTESPSLVQNLTQKMREAYQVCVGPYSYLGYKHMPRDFSFSERTAWMKESVAGEFYELYLEWSHKSHQAIRKVTLSEDAREFLGEDPDCVSERRFYSIATDMADEERMGFLRDFIIGYEMSYKEAEARISEWKEIHPMDEMPPEQLGVYIAEMMMEGMGLPPKKKEEA